MSTATTTSKPWIESVGSVAFASLMALACSAPFESLEPFGRWAGMQITQVEVVLGISILLGGGYLVLNGARSALNTQLTPPAVLLILMMLLSSLFAEDHRGEAIRFVGRFAAGFLVFLLTANLLNTRLRIFKLMTAVAAIGSLVAVLSVLESLGSGSVSSLLDTFKPGTFYAGGLIRASSTLQYPTIASMYLEIAFGFGMGLLVLCLTTSRRWVSLLLFVSLLVLTAGILSTLTRGGLLALAAQLALALFLYFKVRGRDRGLGALVALTLFIGALFFSYFVSHPTYRLRLLTQNLKGWYKAGFEVPSRLVFFPGELKEVPVNVTNLGEIVWRPDGPFPFYVSYHWMDEKKDSVIVFEGSRSILPKPVFPGSSVHVRARVQAPRSPGRYRLAWDVVQEDRVWFGSESGISAFSSVRVQGSEPEKGELEGPPLPKSESLYQLDRPTLWKGVFLILLDRPLTGVGPGNFRLFYGDYLGMETWNRSLHANNTFLEFFAGTGLLGGLAFLWFWFRLLTTLIESSRRRVGALFPMLVAGATSVAAIFLHGMVDDFFAFTPTYVMIWMSFGLVVAISKCPGRRNLDR